MKNYYWRGSQVITEMHVRALLDEAKLSLKDKGDGELKEVLNLFYSKIVMDRDKIVYHINLSSFFQLGYEVEEKVLEFDQDVVVKYKGNLNKIMFRQQQAEKTLIS